MIFGVSVYEQSVLRGGAGNDTIYAGGFGTDSSDNFGEIYYESFSDSEEGFTIYIYGDEGHDMIFGADDVP